MTFRAKPVVKRAHRPAWEGQDRRNFYLNIGFGVIVVLAAAILIIAAGLSWYNDHLAPVGSVDGQGITKDELRDRLTIETWRIDEAERRIRTAVIAGTMTEAEATTQQQILTQQRQQITIVSLEKLIDQKIQSKLAVTEGVAVTPSDIDARLVEEATTPESRHAWVIAVKPAADPGSFGPTDAQKAVARERLTAALADIKAGKAWEDVARTTSTDSATASQGGDAGWLKADDPLSDEPYLKAVFAAAVNTPTEIIEGADGIFRIGRVSEIAAESVDPLYVDKIKNDNIDIAKYRAAVEGDVTYLKLQDKIVANMTGPGPQRQVAEIYIPDNSDLRTSNAIKIRHIQFSPKDDGANASSLKADDPAWALAEAEATAAYQKLEAQPELFDTIARTESDETQARGATGTGGKLPYFDQDSNIPQAFKDAIFAEGVKAGQLLKPVKSDFGWHVIQVMYFPPDIDHLKELKTKADAGADFATLARDNSEADSASLGGDIGWVAKGQLAASLTDAIFAAPIGKTSETVIIPNDGVYLFKVGAEETRTPEGRQLEQIKQTAFSDWYQAHKTVTPITRDPSITGSDS